RVAHQLPHVRRERLPVALRARVAPRLQRRALGRRRLLDQRARQLRRAVPVVAQLAELDAFDVLELPGRRLAVGEELADPDVDEALVPDSGDRRELARARRRAL